MFDVPDPRVSTILMPYRRPRRLPGQSRALRLGLLLVLAFAGAGCADSNVWVFVDNGAKDAMVVTVDGEEVASIAPGKYQRLVIPPGQHPFRVKCGSKILFDDVKDLQPGSSLVGRRYFFNPDNRNRYQTLVVKYGTSLKDVLEPILQEAAGVDRNSIDHAYRQLLKEVRLLPADAWFEVPQGAQVLTPPPEFVTSRSGSATRSVLARVEPKDYTFLKSAQDKKNPTKADLISLADVVERVLDPDL